MQINKKYINSIHCYPGQNSPIYIVIHETDNYSSGANAKKHAEAHYNGNLSTSVHYYVDDGLQGSDAVYQTLPHTDGAWAVGKQYGTPLVANANNNNTINIEICVNPETQYEIARLNCVELVKQLMKELNIDSDHVIRHYDAKRKWCPRKMMDFPELWTDFKLRIQGIIDEITSYEDEHGYWYFEQNGEMLKNQWVKYKNKWFYASSDGKMLAGVYSINGLVYCFNPFKTDMSLFGALMVTDDEKQGNLIVQFVD